jgi:serpin B
VKSIAFMRPVGAIMCLSVAMLHAAESADLPDPPAGEVVASMNAFACDLYGRLADASEDNLFLSPASISTALAMTYAGAGGDTESQMAAVLHLPRHNVHGAFGGMVDYVNALGEQDKFDLTIANALWGQRGYAFRPEFLDLLDRHYGAGLQPVDFRTDTEAARRTINTWVEQQTRDKIQDLIPSGVLTAASRLVLTNAIYFRGDWQEQFSVDRTQPLPFTTAAGERVKTPTMFQEARFQYAEDDTAQCLEMSYAGGDMAMTILLPRKADGLSGLESRLDAAVLERWSGKLRSRQVQVYLPKFSMTVAFQLKSALAAMGMPDAFVAGSADFSGMDGTRELFLQEVVHKAMVDVNETGTEAAAATGVVVGITSLPPPPVVFRAEHPFLFFIRDTRTGVVLFLGRLNTPNGSTASGS